MKYVYMKCKKAVLHPYYTMWNMYMKYNKFANFIFDKFTTKHCHIQYFINDFIFKQEWFKKKGNVRPFMTCNSIHILNPLSFQIIYLFCCKWRSPLHAAFCKTIFLFCASYAPDVYNVNDLSCLRYLLLGCIIEKICRCNTTFTGTDS